MRKRPARKPRPVPAPRHSVFVMSDEAVASVRREIVFSRGTEIGFLFEPMPAGRPAFQRFERCERDEIARVMESISLGLRR